MPPAFSMSMPSRMAVATVLRNVFAHLAHEFVGDGASPKRPCRAAVCDSVRNFAPVSLVLGFGAMVTGSRLRAVPLRNPLRDKGLSLTTVWCRL